MNFLLLFIKEAFLQKTVIIRNAEFVGGHGGASYGPTLQEQLSLTESYHTPCAG